MSTTCTYSLTTSFSPLNPLWLLQRTQTLPKHQGRTSYQGLHHLCPCAPAIFVEAPSCWLQCRLYIEASFITYECLIMMYGYCDCVSKARGIFDGIMASGQETKVSTLNAMLDVYCMNGLQIEADTLFESTRNTRVSSDASTYKLA